MNFAEAAKDLEPAAKVYGEAFEIVFDQDDPNTEHVERLTDEARLVYLLWIFDGEIHNGGFDQFFFNSLGDYWAEILAHLETVGASHSRRLLTQSAVRFPGGKPSSDRHVRQDQLEAFCDDEAYQAEIGRLNDEYYEYKDNLTSLLDAYVAKHPDATVRR